MSISMKNGTFGVGHAGGFGVGSGIGQLLMGLAFGSLISVSLTGNVLVCAAVATNKKLRKKENLYFVSLAGADLLLSVLVMPFAAIGEIIARWPFGGYCKYWMCFDILCCTASILHLAAISFDRYSHIHDPMRYEQNMSIKKIGAVISAVWIVSIFVAFVPLAFDTNFHRALVRQTPTVNDLRNITATTDNDNYSPIFISSEQLSPIYQCRFELDPLYAILSSLASFYIPCALMIAAYGKLYRYAQKHSKAIRKQREEVRIPLLVSSCANGAVITTSSSMPSMPAPNGSPATNKSTTTIKADGDQKARVTLGVITGVFVASWLPFFVANIVRSWCSSSSVLTDTEIGHGPQQQSTSCLPQWLFVLLTWIGYANSAANPAIYSIFNRDFRRAFRKILLCRQGRRRRFSGTTSSFCASKGVVSTITTVTTCSSTLPRRRNHNQENECSTLIVNNRAVGLDGQPSPNSLLSRSDGNLTMDSRVILRSCLKTDGWHKTENGSVL